MSASQHAGQQARRKNRSGLRPIPNTYRRRHGGLLLDGNNGNIYIFAFLLLLLKNLSAQEVSLAAVDSAYIIFNIYIYPYVYYLMASVVRSHR